MVIQVEDVNETPVFENEMYTAEIFSVTPFRYPLVTVKVGDSVGHASFTGAVSATLSVGIWTNPWCMFCFPVGTGP